MELNGRLHAPAALPTGNNPGIQRIGGFWKRKKSLMPLPGFEPAALLHIHYIMYYKPTNLH
jgi:hypothetical protein